MSEFYASGSFLDRKHLFVKYYSIISCITLRESEIEYTAKRLKQYSGFGIEAQIANLDRCCRQLKDLKEDVRTEFYSLVKIVDTVNEYENKAVGILGGTLISSSKSDFTLKEYEDITSPPITWQSFLDMYFKNFKVTDKALGLLDTIVNSAKDITNWSWFDNISKHLSGMKSIFNGVNIGKYFYDLYKNFSDGKITSSELLSISNGSISAFKSFGKIVEKVCDVKIFTKFGKVTSADTLKIGNTSWGKITSWLPVIGVVLSTGIGYEQKYRDYTSDGDYTLNEKCRTASYGSMKGLSTIATLIPFVGPIWAVTDTVLQYNGIDVVDNLNNGIFDAIDNEMNDTKNLLIDLGTKNESFRKEYLRSSNFKQQVIFYSLMSQDILRKMGLEIY